MSMFVIKNIDNILHSYNGIDIEPGGAYIIPKEELSEWANCNVLISDIATHLIIVNNGENDIQDSSQAIDYLKGLVPGSVISTPTRDYSLDMNAIDVAVTRNAELAVVQSFDFKLENYANENYVYKHLLGAMAFGQNIVHGDYVSSQIVDVDGITGYPAGTVLKSFVRKAFLDPINQIGLASFAPASINVGLYIRINFHAMPGSGDAKIFINLNLFNKVEETS